MVRRGLRRMPTSRARQWAILVLTVVSSAAITRPCAALQQRSPAFDSVRAMDSLWARNYATHDTTRAALLMSDRMVMTSSDGRMKDKATELGDVRPSAGLRMHHFRTSDVRVELHGTAAVVTGVADWAFNYNGRESAVRRRYTAVYARGGRLGWELVALHMGVAPPTG
jgi:ketosteroid isomerase-like protein